MPSISTAVALYLGYAPWVGIVFTTAGVLYLVAARFARKKPQMRRGTLTQALSARPRKGKERRQVLKATGGTILIAGVSSALAWQYGPITTLTPTK